MRTNSITPRFTDRIPQSLEDGVLYISEKFSTSAHNCCCGCGQRVVLPLKPGKWSITRRSDRISLSPSVGNWSLACQSHYWIQNNTVRWAGKFTASQIRENRARDKLASQVAHNQNRIHERGFWQRSYDQVKALFSKR